MNERELRAVEALTDELAETRKRVAKLERKTDLSRSAVDSGTIEVFNEDGEVALSIGANEDGTTTMSYVAGPKPNRPSKPILTPGIGALTVTWDGRLLTPEGMETSAPEDFLNVQIFITADETEDDLAVIPMSGVITAKSGGSKTLALDYGTYHVRLVALSLSGQESEVSEMTTADVERLIDAPDISQAMTELDQAISAANADLASSAQKIEELRARFVFSTQAPTLADAQGRLEGSVWTQTTTVNGVTSEVARWQLTNGAWVKIGLDPTLIPNLLGYLATFQKVNVSQLVATNATMETATILKLFTEIFTAKKITSAEIEAGAIQATNIASQAITSDKIQAGSITADKLSVNALDAATINSGTFSGGTYTLNSRTTWIGIGSQAVPETGLGPFGIYYPSNQMGASITTLKNFGHVNPHSIQLNPYTHTDTTSGLSYPAITPVQGSYNGYTDAQRSMGIRMRFYVLGDYAVTTLIGGNVVPQDVSTPFNIDASVSYRRTNDKVLLTKPIGITSTKKVGSVVKDFGDGAKMGWWEIVAEAPYLDGHTIINSFYYIKPVNAQLASNYKNRPQDYPGKVYAVNGVSLDYNDSGSYIVLSTKDRVPGIRGYDAQKTNTFSLSPDGLDVARVRSSALEGTTARLDSPSAATTSSTDHALQLGTSNATNLRLDTTGVTAASNGALAPLNLTGSSVTVNGPLSSSGIAVNGPISSSGTARLTNTTTATASSTGHAFQIGPNNGVNLRLDTNDILAASNGSLAPLNLTGSQVNINGLNYAVNYGPTTVPISDTTNFAYYGSQPIQVMRSGPMVTVTGVIKCLTVDYIKSNTQRTFAVLPSWAIPLGVNSITIKAQGSGTDTWLFQINANDGGLSGSRYSGATQGAGVWLPFSATYLVA